MKERIRQLLKAAGKSLGMVAALLSTATATALADSINLSEVTANTTIADGTTLTGTLGANVKISIADGATVMLDGVAINGVNDEDNCSWAGITCEGGATIILKGANTVKGFYEDYPGIHVPEGKTLTIKGDGSLDASSNGYGAGIGGGYEISCGNIVIEGGTIVATGGGYAAGIGGGSTASCGDITIADTVTRLTVTAGEGAEDSIGKGADGSCGTVTIGGEEYPDGVVNSPFTFLNLAKLTEDTVITGDATVFGTLAANVKISIADGATVTLDGVTIKGVSTSSCKWAGINCLGDATIILAGTNSVKGFEYTYSGIHVPQGKTLTIKGDGSLDASSNGYGAGIGGGYEISCGNIVIEGGTIVATGGDLAAGIGGGGGSACGDITIADTVTKVVATRRENTPCSIGKGAGGTCGTVTIGGTVYPGGITQSPYIYPSYTATLKDGTEDAANWTITPNEGVAESNTVTIAYAGTNKVKSVKATMKAAAGVTAYTLAESTVGMIVGTDGNAYAAAYKDNLPSGVTAAGMVAYKSGSNGLVIALADEASTMNWSTATGASGAAAHTPTITGQTWKLPSQNDWKQMLSANGGSENSYTGLNSALATAGGDSSKLQANADYWSSTEHNSGYARDLYLGSSAVWTNDNKGNGYRVRACLAFEGGEATSEAAVDEEDEVTEEIEIAVTPVAGKTNEWTFQMPAADVKVVVEYFTQEEVDSIAAAKAAIEEIGTVDGSEEASAKVAAARKAYDALTDEQKALVENYGLLPFAEAKVDAFAEGTPDAENWTIAPYADGKFSASSTVTLAYGGSNKVKSVKAVEKAPYTLLSAATAEDVGKVVCADGHLHDEKTAVPDGCTAVGVIGKVTETGHGLILALQDATTNTWNTIDGWESTTDYAGTTLKVLPDDDARGANLTSYTALGNTAVSDWAVGQKSDYEAIFTNLGSTMGDDYGKTYDDHVEDYITTGVGGAAISGGHLSATESSDTQAFVFYPYYYWYPVEKTSVSKVRPVLGFGGAAAEEIAVTPVEDKTNEWTFVMPAADVVVEVEYFAVASFEVDGETYAVITNVVGKAVETPAEDPVKTGHSFAGWFTEATGGTQITDETLMGAADTTFYAQFNEPILTIENGVLTAVDFNGCTNVTLTIPDTVTAIGESVFNDCTDLASVTIPGSVKTISHAAFRDCTSLVSVTIEEGATTIGERAFYRCVNLASITIPGTVTAIGEAAFRECTSLTSLTIPGSVKTIEPHAFQSCTGLESVTIEEGVETIGRVAFDDCENLASVTIPDSVKEIGRNAFAGCSDALYAEGTGNLAGVKLVDGWAVGYDKTSISENLDLTGVRGIADGAFSGCDIITSVIIPDGITAIGEGAFEGCDNLASVTIPDSVTAIGEGAFAGCSEDLYDTTTLTGVQLVDGWAVGYTDALPENLDLTGVRGIANRAFRESTLESVTIPGTVARVPSGAFMSCSSLASVTLEEGVTAIDNSAFAECSALESVEIPGTVTAIGMEAFVGCAQLASVTVPGSVAEIGQGAFGMCGSLTNITIEAGVTNIGMMAFAMCSSLESVEIPDTVTAIGSQAFFFSMNFASVTIPSSVMEIGQDAFAYTALSTVNVDYGDGERVKELLTASGFDVSNLTFVEPLMLTFDPAGGEFAEGVETNRFIYAGDEFGELPEATRTGYTFNGWFTAATEGDQVTATSKMGDADATVYAQWTINQYTITFDPAGGSDVAAITNDYGYAVTAPEDPSKTGYTFAGWTPAVPETIPASNTVCTAGWIINQYTISFDVNGGEGEFDPATLDYGAEYGELPVPVRTGYTFLGWFDADGNEATAETVLGDADVALAARWGINRYTITFVVEDETYAEITDDYGAAVTAPADPDRGSAYEFLGWDKEVPATIPAEDVTLTALWKLMQIDVPAVVGGDTNTTVNVTVGEKYTDAVIDEITKAAQATAERHGRAVAGWVNYDGSEVTGDTIVSTNDVLTAVWESVNPLVPETLGEGAVDTARAQTYEAYILDADGAMRGTVVVTVGKANKKSGLSSVKARVKLLGDKKNYTFKATGAKGGKAAISADEATEGVELANKDLGTMTLDIGAEGVTGTLGEYEINGSRNTYKTEKAVYAAWEGVWTAAIADAATGAYSTFTVKIKKNGAVKIKGVMAGGVKLSTSTQLMIADDGSEACVAVNGSKKAPVGFTLWFGLDENGEAFFEGVESGSGAAAGGDAIAAGAAFAADAEDWVLSVGGEEKASLVWDGKKFTGGKEISAKVKFAKSTGLFSGSYKVETTAANGRTKKTTVKFSGVFVEGVGYGATTAKGAAPAPVVLVPGKED